LNLNVINLSTFKDAGNPDNSMKCINKDTQLTPASLIHSLQVVPYKYIYLLTYLLA